MPDGQSLRRRRLCKGPAASAYDRPSSHIRAMTTNTRATIAPALLVGAGVWITTNRVSARTSVPDVRVMTRIPAPTLGTVRRMVRLEPLTVASSPRGSPSSRRTTLEKPPMGSSNATEATISEPMGPRWGVSSKLFTPRARRVRMGGSSASAPGVSVQARVPSGPIGGSPALPGGRPSSDESVGWSP